MELITSPAKKYVNSDITFKVKLPAYETRRVEGTFLDEEGTKQDGKTLITYKGNTSQNGTPTPSSPIDVNVVTGENKVVVSNKNLIDWANPTGANTPYTFVDDILTVTNSLTTYRLIRYEITDLFKKNPGKSIYFQNDGLVKTGGGNNIVIRIVYNDGTPQTDNNITSSKKIEIPSVVSNITSVNIRIASAGIGSVTITKPMIAFGEIATEYIQHQKQNYTIDIGSIELCKIGNYQDRIYRQNAKWYIHKEVGKVVLNGTETILNSASVGTNTRYIISYTGVTNVQALCNQYKYLANYTNDSEHFYFANNQIIIFDSEANDVAFRNKLATNKPEFYYILSTPTDTEITNQALISQLEYIKNNLKTYEEETIINQVNSDLPFYLDVLMEI